jgi:protease I
MDPADYAAPVIPGGRAPEYIRNDAGVRRIVRQFMNGEYPSPSCAPRAWPDHPAWMRGCQDPASHGPCRPGLGSLFHVKHGGRRAVQCTQCFT